MTELEAFRVYANDATFMENLPRAILKKEIHVVVPFARDFISRSNNLGNFDVAFNKGKFYPTSIQTLKDNSAGTRLKFFLSIGCRRREYQFAVTSDRANSWSTNATQTLERIIKEYKFDGIDVYYEYIDANTTNQFVETMNDVVWKLKSEGIVSEASITISAPLSAVYFKLYDKNPTLFNYVVYQTHTETSNIPTYRQLADVFDKIPSSIPRNKIFAGYSDLLPSDWTTVPLPTFLGAVPRLLQDKKLLGISKWLVNDPALEP